MSILRVDQLQDTGSNVTIDVTSLGQGTVTVSSEQDLKTYPIDKQPSLTTPSGVFVRKTGAFPVLADDNNYIQSNISGYYWEKVEKVSATPKNYIVGMYWRNNLDTSTDLYTSQDGTFYSRVTGGRMRVDNGVSMAGRDNDLFYWKGHWYTTNTNYGTDANGTWDFFVYRSKDLQNWTLFRCKLGATAKYNTTTSTVGGVVPTNFLWAPKFFVSNGQLSISISIRYGADTTNYLGATIMAFQTFTSTVSDLQTMQFSEPVRVVGSALTSCYIDSHIYNVEGGWWLLCQNSVTQKIEIFKSSSLNSFDASPIVLSSSVYMEAPSLLKIYNPDGSYKYIIQGDSTNGYYAAVSTDLGVTWSAFGAQQFQYNVRHGTCINLVDVEDSDAAIKTVENFKSYSGDGSQTAIAYEVDLATLVGGTPGVVDLDPIDDVIYYVGNTSITLNITARVARRFYVAVKSGLASSGITFGQTGYFPRNNAAIGYGKTNDTIFEIRLSSAEGQYYITAPSKVGCAIVANKNGTDQTVSTGVSTKVTFPNIQFAQGTGYTAANSRILIPNGVKARLQATIMVTGGIVAGQSLLMQVVANGSAVYREVVIPAVSTGNQSLSINALILGDGVTYHEVFVTLNGSSTLTINGNSSRTFLELSEVG